MPKGPLYTPQEDAQIQALFDKRVTVRGIAAATGRSKSSVQGRMHHLGLMRKWAWTAEDDSQLRAFAAAHLPDNEIATIMNRTVAAVRLRTHLLGIKRDGRATRLAKRYGVAVLANGKDPAALLAELREAEEQKHVAAEAERRSKIETLLDEMERGLVAGCDRAFMFTAALVAGATLQVIGDRVGLTRERVRQIIEARNCKSNGSRPSNT